MEIREKLNIQYKNNSIPRAYGGKILYKDIKKGVFIMNNHRWAYYCWEKYFPISKYSNVLLLHIDQHPDALLDINEQELKKTQYLSLTDFLNHYFMYANFLYPYLLKYKKNVTSLNLVHSSEMKNSFKAKENHPFKHKTFKGIDLLCKELSNHSYDAIILDVDLDYFITTIDNENLEHWKTEKISNFFTQLLPLIKKEIKIITIATSPSLLSDFGTSEQEKLDNVNKILSVVKKGLSINN